MKKNYPKIAILLASFNGEKYISEQINSILKQKDVLIDIFISDDASNDGTLKIIQSYCNKYKNIKCINKDRVGGPGKNFYYLMKQVDFYKYDFIALSDQDDIWPEYRLSRALDQLKKHKAFGYSSNVMAVSSDMKLIKVIEKSQPQQKFDYYFETPGPGCTFVLLTEAAKHIKSKLESDINFQDFPYHDWLIYALMRQNNFKWIIDNAPNLLYRQHELNYMGANQGFFMLTKRLNRILFGEYYRELVLLHKLLESKNLDFLRVWSFILNFRKTRRIFFHSILMIPFLFILSIQKNEA